MATGISYPAAGPGTEEAPGACGVYRDFATASYQFGSAADPTGMPSSLIGPVRVLHMFINLTSGFFETQSDSTEKRRGSRRFKFHRVPHFSYRSAIERSNVPPSRMPGLSVEFR
jgi:hypothetical protein